MCHSSVQRMVALLPRRVWPDHSCITLSTRTHTHTHTHMERSMRRDDPPGPYLPTTPESGSLHTRTRTRTRTHTRNGACGGTLLQDPTCRPLLNQALRTHTHTQTHTHTHTHGTEHAEGRSSRTSRILPANHSCITFSTHTNTHAHTHTRSGACGGTLLQDPTHNSYHADLNTATVDNFPSSWGSIKTHFKCAHMPLLH